MPFNLRSRLPFTSFADRPFEFLDTGPLIDQELELVKPAPQWVDAVLASGRHPLSLAQTPPMPAMSRRQLLDFLETCPDGRQQPSSVNQHVAGYYFWMLIRNNPAIPIAGGIGLRISDNRDTVMYCGHIGYHVYPPHRGHHYAERACRLLFPLARRHGIEPLWITCNPENIPSRRTCQRLGGEMVEIVPVPRNHPLYLRGETEKCRFKFHL